MHLFNTDMDAHTGTDKCVVHIYSMRILCSVPTSAELAERYPGCHPDGITLCDTIILKIEK